MKLRNGAETNMDIKNNNEMNYDDKSDNNYIETVTVQG